MGEQIEANVQEREEFLQWHASYYPMGPFEFTGSWPATIRSWIQQNPDEELVMQCPRLFKYKEVIPDGYKARVPTPPDLPPGMRPPPPLPTLAELAAIKSSPEYSDVSDEASPSRQPDWNAIMANTASPTHSAISDQSAD